MLKTILLRSPNFKLFFFLLSVFFFVFFVNDAFAQTYYVSSTHANRSDTNAGTDSDYPWEHIPYSAQATGNAASYTASAGDSILLKRGDTWRPTSGVSIGEFSNAIVGITDGGSEGSLVTWGAYGSGDRPKLILNGSCDGGIVLSSDSSDDDPSYTIIENIEIDCNDQGNGIAILVSQGDTNNSLSNITVQNCEIHSTRDSEWRSGIIMRSSEANCTISSCYILNNEIYDLRNHGITFYPLGECGSNNDNVIRANTIHNSSVGVQPQYAIHLNQIGDGNIVEFNTIYGAFESAGICIDGGDAGAAGQTNAKIRYNIIRNLTDAYAAIVLQCHGNAHTGDIYGNLIFGCDMEAFRLATMNGPVTISHFANNTIYSNCDNDPTAPEIDFNDSDLTVTNFTNNIIYSDHAGMCLYGAAGTISNHHSNVMYRTTGAGDPVVYYGSSYTRSTYTNWEADGYSVDPNFKNTPNLPTGFSGTYGTDMEPDNDGLSIESGNAIDNGYSLERPYDRSINSVLRPSGSGFDIGAYELPQGDFKPPNPPTGLTIISSMTLH